MAVSTVRDLVAGSGTVATSASVPNQLTFSTSQSFKEGTAIVVDPSGTPQYFTIDSGSDKIWNTLQAASSAVSGKSFNQTQTSTSRARGGANSVIIPDAAHFVYRSILDSASPANADAYLYVDSIFPEKGLHPYTRDQYTGVTLTSAKAVAEFVPDINTRVKVLEGVNRYSNGTSGSIAVPDKRLRDIESRVNLIEVKLNGGATPPTQTVTPPTKQQLLDLGDL